MACRNRMLTGGSMLFLQAISPENIYDHIWIYKPIRQQKHGDLWIVSIEKDFDVVKDQLWWDRWQQNNNIFPKSSGLWEQWGKHCADLVVATRKWKHIGKKRPTNHNVDMSSWKMNGLLTVTEMNVLVTNTCTTTCLWIKHKCERYSNSQK